MYILIPRCYYILHTGPFKGATCVKSQKHSAIINIKGVSTSPLTFWCNTKIYFSRCCPDRPRLYQDWSRNFSGVVTKDWLKLSLLLHFLPPRPLLFCSTQPPTAYSHPSTASYSVQQASAVAHAVTASYSPAPVQAARPVVSAPYPAYQSHQAPPEYAYRQPEPPAPPQPTTTPQTYQVYSDMVSLFRLPLWILLLSYIMWSY